MRKDHAVYLLALLLCARVFAQTTGAIEGVLSDPSGAAIVGAAVKLTNTGTGVAASTTTNASGYFLVDGLGVGVYDIEASQPGFKTYTVKGLIVDATARVHRDI